MRRTRAGPASTTGTSAASPAASRRSSARRTSCRTTTTIRTRCAATGASPPISPPEASAIQATPTSFVSVSKWTRTHTNRLLFDAGFGVYDQQYNENYQPDVFAGDASALDDSAIRPPTRPPTRWNNPAEHFSKLFTEQFAASYVTGSHSFRFGAVRQPGEMAAHAAVHPRRAAGHLQRCPTAGSTGHVTLRIPTDRRNSIKNDSARVRPGPVDDQAGHDQRGRALGLVHQRDRSRERSRPAPSTRPPNTRPALTARTTLRRAASAASRTGRTSARVSVCPTICSATAGPP